MSDMPSIPDDATGRRFFQRLMLGMVATLAVCALLNAAIDPYGLYRWIDRPGVNEIKPRATQAIEAFKYRAVQHRRPNTLLLGNSRAEMGWDPQRLAESAYGSVVNASMPGRGLEAMLPLADHAWTVSAPTLLIVGLEFFDCLDSEPASPQPLALHAPVWSVHHDEPLHRAERLLAMAAQSLSLDATLDSLRTLWAQVSPHAAHLRRDGFQTARDYPAMQAIDGARKMFLQRDHENARVRVNGPTAVRHANGSLAACFRALDSMLDAARARGQRVLLATYPYHARLLETIVHAGLWPSYEEWKTLLAERAGRHRQQGLAVELRDFGSYHAYAAERVPSGPSDSVPKWYWESGHFRAELGSRMLLIMVGEAASDGLFGAELRESGVAAHLAAVRASRQAFLSEQPETTLEMARIATNACRIAPGRSCRFGPERTLETAAQ